MKLESVLGTSISELGLRFTLVGILPSATLALFVLVLVWSGAPSNEPQLNLIVDKIKELEATESVFLIIAIIIFSLILQPLQLSLVRILEGYWGDSRFGNFLNQLGIKIQKRRRDEREKALLKYLFSWDENDIGVLIDFLKNKYNIPWIKKANIEKIDGSRAIKIRLSFKDNFLSLNLNDDKTKVNLKIDDDRTDEFIAKTENGKLNIYRRKDAADISSPKELAHMQSAARDLRQLYPAENQLLPTALGNVLRAAEDMPAKRYGLDAVVIWPLLYPLLSDELKSILADQRNQLDLAARFCAVFLLITIISTAFLFRHGWWLTIPASALLIAWLSYKAAIAAALAYRESILAAFDLHRFDLLKALHLSLPSDPDSEKQANQELSDFLRQGLPMNFQYEHH